MGSLIDRLKDASRSGAYRVARASELLEAASEGALCVARIDLAGVHEKAELLRRVAQVREFPDWFGRNWDALEDCLTDLSWWSDSPVVLLIEKHAELPRDVCGVFADVLASAAEYWAERGRPFFAVFVGGPESLPELHRARRR